MGSCLLVSCLEAFSGNLSSFFKLVHTILSCSLSVIHIFISSFSLSSFSSPPPPPPPAFTHQTTHTHRVFLHHVVCSSIRVLQRNLLLSSDGKMCRQYVPPKQWGPVHQIVLWEPLKLLSSGFSFYTLQCFSVYRCLWCFIHVFIPYVNMSMW